MDWEKKRDKIKEAYMEGFEQGCEKYRQQEVMSLLKRRIYTDEQIKTIINKAYARGVNDATADSHMHELEEKAFARGIKYGETVYGNTVSEANVDGWKFSKNAPIKRPVTYVTDWTITYDDGSEC